MSKPRARDLEQGDFGGGVSLRWHRCPARYRWASRVARDLHGAEAPVSYGRLGLAAVRWRPSPKKGEAPDYPAAHVQNVEYNDK